MNKRIIALVALFATMLFSVVGCAGKGAGSEESTFAANLYAAKNPYIENTSANNDLVGLLGVGNYGKYTLSVNDDAHPYTLKISFMYLDNSVDQSTMDAKMLNVAIALLALIDDCEQVDWSYPGSEGLVTGAVGVDYAKEVAGTDVKKAGKDEATFSSLCNKLFPDKALAAEDGSKEK